MYRGGEGRRVWEDEWVAIGGKGGRGGREVFVFHCLTFSAKACQSRAASVDLGACQEEVKEREEKRLV